MTSHTSQYSHSIHTGTSLEWFFRCSVSWWSWNIAHGSHCKNESVNYCLKNSNFHFRYCSCISFANSRVSEDSKQVLSSFMLSISAVVMSYLQNPAPMTANWSWIILWIPFKTSQIQCSSHAAIQINKTCKEQNYDKTSNHTHGEPKWTFITTCTLVDLFQEGDRPHLTYRIISHDLLSRTWIQNQGSVWVVSSLVSLSNDQ